MAAPNKQRTVTKALSHLAKVYEDSFSPDLSVLDHLLLGVLQEETSFPIAMQAYDRVRASVYDFNELRVSQAVEVEGMLEGVPDREIKAKRLLDILQFVFETTYSFDLESMRRKPLKQAHKQLSKITGTTDFTVAATVQRALGGHALPIDNAMCGVLAKLELIEPEQPPQEVRGALEHLVPKAKGVAFCLLISAVAADEKQDEVLAALLPKPKKKAEKKSEAEKPKKRAPAAPAETPVKPKASTKAKK